MKRGENIFRHLACKRVNDSLRSQEMSFILKPSPFNYIFLKKKKQARIVCYDFCMFCFFTVFSGVSLLSEQFFNCQKYLSKLTEWNTKYSGKSYDTLIINILYIFILICLIIWYFFGFCEFLNSLFVILHLLYIPCLPIFNPDICLLSSPLQRSSLRVLQL